MDLIPRRIARLEGVFVRESIRVPNSSDATVVVDEAGQEWVHKELMGSNQVLAEAIAFLLCNRLHLPVPVGGVTRDGRGSSSWLSRLVSSPSHWDPVLFESIVDGANLIGTMYTVDALVANEDRHDGNVLLEHQGKGVLRAWCIDFANAHIGSPRGLLEARDLVPNPTHHHFRPAPMSGDVRRRAVAAADQVRSIPHACLAADAHEACDAASCPDLEQALTEVLCYRCSVIPAIVATYLQRLESCR